MYLIGRLVTGICAGGGVGVLTWTLTANGKDGRR